MSSANVEDFENENNVYEGYDSGNERDEGGVEAGAELVRKKNETAVIWQFLDLKLMRIRAPHHRRGHANRH
jgi:hypothetical protein